MNQFTKKNRKNIQTIFEEKTGVKLAENRVHSKNQNLIPYFGSFCFAKFSMAVGVVVCFLALSAFAYSQFNALDGDEAGFYPTYLGDGIFSILITNSSDKDLKLQEQVKLMRWSTGKEVEGNAQAVTFENMEIPAHSEETVLIDLSEAYDIEALEQELPAGDWYYLVLTNNHFAFGQDWMCSLHFAEEEEILMADGLTTEGNPLEDAYSTMQGNRTEDKNVLEDIGNDSNGEIQEVSYEGVLEYESWVWPTVSEKISSLYGVRNNGVTEIRSDHINIAGALGDEVYAVADGKVLETGYVNTYGNYILLEVGEETTVKYGHLKSISVKEGDNVERGQVIGTMGVSGMATGPNLAFLVYENGEAVNPLAELSADE